MRILLWIIGALVVIGVLGYFLDPSSPRHRGGRGGMDDGVEGPPRPEGMDAFGNTEGEFSS